jgi:uncharacterized protein YbaR (Trm112 family)
MAVPQELLDILVCPACKLPIQLTPDDDIPDMIIEDAKVEAE